MTLQNFHDYQPKAGLFTLDRLEQLTINVYDLLKENSKQELEEAAILASIISLMKNTQTLSVYSYYKLRAVIGRLTGIPPPMPEQPIMKGWWMDPLVLYSYIRGSLPLKLHFVVDHCMWLLGDAPEQVLEEPMKQNFDVERIFYKKFGFHLTKEFIINQRSYSEAGAEDVSQATLYDVISGRVAKLCNHQIVTNRVNSNATVVKGPSIAAENVK